MKVRQQMWRFEQGFSLVELMVVVAIIAVLSAIAMPQYSAYVSRGNRIAARGQLLSVAQYMERVRSQNFSYGSSSRDYSEYLAGVNSDAAITGKYTIAISSLSTSTFALVATPNEGGPAAHDECGSLTLDHRGNKGNSSGTYAACWGR